MVGMSDTEAPEELASALSDSDEPLSSDQVYSVLADKRRRYAVHFLKQAREPVSVRDLAEQIAAWENGKELDEITSQERKRVYISLYQSHLPTLDKNGVVEYDADRSQVSLSDRMANTDIYLEVVPAGNVPWSLYYVGLSVVNAVLLGFAWFEVYPFALLPELAWGAIVLVTFGMSAFVQTYYNRQMRFGDEGPPPDLQRPE